jgi:hypothetical protein
VEESAGCFRHLGLRPGRHAAFAWPSRGDRQNTCFPQNPRPHPYVRTIKAGGFDEAVNELGDVCQDNGSSSTTTTWHISPSHARITASISGKMPANAAFLFGIFFFLYGWRLQYSPVPTALADRHDGLIFRM